MWYEKNCNWGIDRIVEKWDDGVDRKRTFSIGRFPNQSGGVVLQKLYTAERQVRPMHERRRVDLIFPRSGQVLPIWVPVVMVRWVVERNIQVLSSLFDMDALRTSQLDYLKGLHPKPS